MNSTARFYLIVLPLLFSVSLGAQAEPEQASYWDRFVAIFQSEDENMQPALTPDPIPNATLPGVKERYAKIYNLIHSDQSQYYRSLVDSSYSNWDELRALDVEKYSSPSGDTIVLAKNIEVFGWHPHWMGNSYKEYNFKLLSHVALFSYNVNIGDGETPYDNPEVIDTWSAEDFDLVPLAQADGCKVLLTVTNFGERANQIFLNDLDRQNLLIEDIVLRVESMGADGVDLDFELIPANYEKRFSDFVKRLRRRLNLSQSSRDLMLTVVLPKVNRSRGGAKIYALDTLQKYVDLFTITAYDFTTRGYAPGPISPLYSYDQRRERRKNGSIEDIVFAYLEDGLPREKLLLGLPYYGGKWTNYSGAGVSDTTVFEHLTYGALHKQKIRRGKPLYDQDSWSATYQREFVPDDSTYTIAKEEIWFDDSLTLSVKYDWVLEQQLAGVGIWALGYDQPRQELWGLIDQKFAPTNDTLVYFLADHQSINLPATILKYRDLIGVTGIFVFALLAIGFIWALFDWRVRDVFFKNATLRILYIVAAFALITATFAFFLYLSPQMIGGISKTIALLVFLVIGLALGTFVVRRVSGRFWRKRSELP